MIKSLKYIFSSCFALGFIFLFAGPVLAAETQIYPKGYGDTTLPGGINDKRLKCFDKTVAEVLPRDGISYITSTGECGGEGDYREDTTEPSGAINHRAGQTFYVPERMVLTRARFNGFIGMKNQTNGGRVLVILRSGDKNGPELSRTTAYFTGWQYNNWLGSENTTYCRWRINDRYNPLTGQRIDNLDGPCILQTENYATSWAVMPFVTPLEINFSTLSPPTIGPGKYSLELLQETGGWGGADDSKNIALGLFNRRSTMFYSGNDPNSQPAAYYIGDPGETEYDAYWEWYPATNEDLAGVAIWGEPSPAATPAIAAPSCASPPNQSTIYSPNNMTFAWGAVSGWTGTYNFRLDEYDPWGGEKIVVNGVSGTSYSGGGSPINLSPNITYRYRVQANNASAPWAECFFYVRPLPSLGNMSIGPGADAQNAGAVRTSGLRSDEGGSNYKNSINITLRTNNIDISNTLAVGAAFTKSAPVGPIAGNMNLYYLTQTAFENNGFVLVYALPWPFTPTRPPSLPYYTTGWLIPFFTFTEGYYYVYYNGTWSPARSAGQEYISPSNEIKVKPTRFSGGELEFNVTLLQRLGNRTWKTYGYLWDGLDNTTFQDYPTP